MLIEGHELTPTLKAIQEQHTDGVDPTVQTVAQPQDTDYTFSNNKVRQ